MKFRNDSPAAEPETESSRPEPAGLPALKLNRVLVPVDFSECSARALDYALAVAAKFDAALVLLHVIEPTPGYAHIQSYGPTLDEANQALTDESYERLVEVYGAKLKLRHTAETLVRIGRAHSEICDTAKALGADLIVMGTHGAAGLKPVSVGSTAEKVVRHAYCPVLTVREGIAVPLGCNK